jgi:hypothetical protein
MKLMQRLGASLLCRRDAPIASAWQAIGWWESRRAAFNLIVGSAGILSGLVIGIVGAGSYLLFDSDFGLPDPPLFAILGAVIYGIMANVCYTGGWIVELGIRRAWPAHADRFATLTLALGVVFAVVLTLSPGSLIGAVGLFGLIGHLLGVVHSVRTE